MYICMYIYIYIYICITFSMFNLVLPHNNVIHNSWKKNKIKWIHPVYLGEKMTSLKLTLLLKIKSIFSKVHQNQSNRLFKNETVIRKELPSLLPLSPSVSIRITTGSMATIGRDVATKISFRGPGRNWNLFKY